LAGCQEGSAGTTAAPIQQGKPPALPEKTPAIVLPEVVPAAEQTPQIAGPAPRIMFGQVVYDFGDIPTGTRHKGQFNFANKGDSPLKIKNVSSCCGVVTNLPKNEFAPGESGVLEIDYGSSTEPGPFRRQLTVSTNDPRNPDVILTIRANAIRVVGFEPSKLTLFLKQENAGCGDITLKSLDGKPFSITGFKATENAITADFDPSVQATKFVLKPKADLKILQNSMRGRISITLSHPQCDIIEMLFDVLPEFTVNPAQILLLKVEPGKPIKRSIWVLSNYSENFEIDSIRSQNGIIKVLKQEKVGNRYQIDVEIMPPPLGENSKRVLVDVLTITMKGGEEMSITCRGFY
jgi:hypothetical protein